MSNLYIRVRTNFYSNRKTIRLRLIIGDDAFWIPPRLWAYAAENQPDGDLSGYGPELAELIGCPKYATSILQALKDSGFVDQDNRIHDWDEHNGYHQKYSERAKKAADARWAKNPPLASPPDKEKKDIESGGKHCSSNASSITSSVSRFQKPTLAELEFQADRIGLPRTEIEKFLNHYESNGWKVGRNPMKSWTHALTNWKINQQTFNFTTNNQKPKRKEFAP